jgi:hypothetical protein
MQKGKKKNMGTLADGGELAVDKENAKQLVIDETKMK